jgi:hypothetical protein
MLHIMGGSSRSVTYKYDGRSIEEICISFHDADMREKALRHLWSYTDLRISICRWLIGTIEDSIFQNSPLLFDSLEKAVAKLTMMDFTQGRREIVNRLVSKESNIWIIYDVIKEMFVDQKHNDNVDQLLEEWAESDSEWLWQIPVLVYADGQEGTYVNVMKRCLEKHLLSLSGQDNLEGVKFISSILYTSRDLQNLLCNMLGDKFNKSPKGKWKVAVLYVWICHYAYFAVDKDEPELPLVYLKSKEQFISLMSVIKYVYSDTSLRTILNEVLYYYMDEIDAYNIEPKPLANLLYNITLFSESHYQNVKAFLRLKMPSDNAIAKFCANYIIGKRKQQQVTLAQHQIGGASS